MSNAAETLLRSKLWDLWNNPRPRESTIAGYLFWVTRRIPKTPLVKSTIIFYGSHTEGRARVWRAGLGDVLTQLPRQCFPAMRDALGTGAVQPLVSSWEDLCRRTGTHDSLSRFGKHLALGARSTNDRTSRVWYALPGVAVMADTDEDAIFELLSQVGGRMPADV